MFHFISLTPSLPPENLFFPSLLKLFLLNFFYLLLYCTFQHSNQRTCISKNKPCTCDEDPPTSSELPITKCHKGDCFTSTCKNCPSTNCFWTRSFRYISETQRNYRDDGGHSHNCFMKSLVHLVKLTLGYDHVKADSERKTCPATCDSLTTCDSCVGSTGKDNYLFSFF